MGAKRYLVFTSGYAPTMRFHNSALGANVEFSVPSRRFLGTGEARDNLVIPQVLIDAGLQSGFAAYDLEMSSRVTDVNGTYASWATCLVVTDAFLRSGWFPEFIFAVAPIMLVDGVNVAVPFEYWAVPPIGIRRATDHTATTRYSQSAKTFINYTRLAYALTGLAGTWLYGTYYSSETHTFDDRGAFVGMSQTGVDQSTFAVADTTAGAEVALWTGDPSAWWAQFDFVAKQAEAVVVAPVAPAPVAPTPTPATGDLSVVLSEVARLRAALYEVQLMLYAMSDRSDKAAILTTTALAGVTRSQSMTGENVLIVNDNLSTVNGNIMGALPDAKTRALETGAVSLVVAALTRR